MVVVLHLWERISSNNATNKKFLKNDTNVKNLKAVISSGNRNFFEDFCIAGDIISKEYNVPYVYRFELLGTPEDVDIVKQGLKEFKV